MANRIDLNCDLGEGSGWDADILPFISSANIAWGYHAGDETSMRATTRLSIEHGIAIGAHPGLPDRADFGRRPVRLAPGRAREIVYPQLETLRDIIRAEGGTLRHVKPHGALYHMATTDQVVAEEIAEAVHSFDRRLVLVGFPGSALLRAGKKLGLRAVAEAFADRTYRPDGSLVPRSQPGALIENAEAAVAQALTIAQDHMVRTAEGRLPLDAETICLHGDGPHAAAFARGVRTRLEAEQVRVLPVWM